MEKNAERTKVGYWSHAPSGCYWYRIKHPMDALRKAGIETVEIPINQDIDDSVIDSLMSVQFYGTYPFSMGKVLEYLEGQGIKIVYDMDDALDLIDETNPFFHSVRKDIGSADEILLHADEVTVSNPRMAEYARGKTKAKVTVVPNCYLPSEWDFPRPPHEGLRIGFAGASPHVPDLIEIIPAIRRIQEKHDARFYIMGFGSSDYESWFKSYRYIAQPRATEELRRLDEALKTIRFEWVPFVDYSVYPQTLISLSLDIGICPLRDTPFNSHRSACKAMEYALAGALCLASDSIPYRDDGNSLLVGEGDWEMALNEAIDDREFLAGTREQFQHWTMENRTMDSITGLLKSVYVV